MIEKQQQNFNKKWWYRLLKVVYIFLYFIIPFIALNSVDGPENVIERTFFLIYLAILCIVGIKIIKISIVYIIKGEKINWKKEFKKLF